MLDYAAIQIRAAEAAAIACVKFAFHRRGTRSLYRSSEPQKLHRGKKQERQSCLSKISIALQYEVGTISIDARKDIVSLRGALF